MPDQRLERLPVPGSLPARRLEEAEQPGWAPGVQPRQNPSLTGIFKFDVVGAHQLARRHIDQPVPEHIGPQQHLAVAAFKGPQVDLVLRQHNPAWRVLVNGSAPDEHPPPADPGHDPGHQGVGVRAA